MYAHFVGVSLSKIPYGVIINVHDCLTQIKEDTCKETNKSFYYTDILHLKKHVLSKTSFKHDEYWYYEKQMESLMYFRNITKIDKEANIICPYCHKVHETK